MSEYLQSSPNLKRRAIKLNFLPAIKHKKLKLLAEEHLSNYTISEIVL